MTILTVLQHPDPRLHMVARPVENFDDALRRHASDMLETMYHHRGIGLAAPQVNVARRVIVVDVSEKQNEPLVLINPVSQSLSNTLSRHEEGCISLPGFYLSVRRPAGIMEQALNTCGEPISLMAEGWLAACVQREIDHLNGQLLTDYAPTKKRSQYRRKH